MRWKPLWSLSLLVSSSLASPPQTAFNASTTRTTIIDILSADPDYTSLLKLLQIARLIPTINKLNGSTLFAPTNDALKDHALWSSVVDELDSSLSTRDNVHEQLRQELLYHLLNYSIEPINSEDNPEVHKTLLYPRKNVDPPSREPPPSPPWLPIPGGTLGGEPQRLRVASLDGDVKVGVNAFGQGGAKVVKGKADAGNGAVFGIGAFVDSPVDLASTIGRQKSLSYFKRIATPEILEYLNQTAGLTLFLPVDAAWDVLQPIERKYLESEFATDDLTTILNLHAVATDGVHWSEEFAPAVNLTTISGTTLEVVRSPESHKTIVSSAELIEPDIYASNGVLHTVSSLLVPPGAFTITPEKYLLTLNCTSFISLLHSVDLTKLVNNTDKFYTILAPRDDVLELFGGDENELPEPGSDKLKRFLSYHFLPGKWTPNKLKDGMLVQTALEEDGLSGGLQVLDISVSGEDGKHKKERSISFGGASVMDFYDLNNTLIYLISRPLTPPSDILETALPDLEFSMFNAAVSSSSSFANRLRQIPKASFLIPVNDGFKRLGLLVSTHLLSATSKADLEAVILHHVINGVEYAKDLINGSQKSYATLEGSDLRVDRSEDNGTVVVQASGGWEGMRATLTARNLLTKTGVVHELSDVLLPRDLNLTISKLVKAAKGSTMATVLIRAGMEWILNGTAPPEDSPYAGAGWTLLCPTDNAFKGFNLTRMYEDPERLDAIVKQHLIPTSPKQALTLAKGTDPADLNKPLLMDDTATYSTLQTKDSAYGDIVFRSSSDSDGKDGAGFLVGIKDARGTSAERDWAHVLAWGRTTTFKGVGGVIQIDQVLMPYSPSWWRQYGAPVGVGIIGVVLIGVFFLGVRAFWRRDTKEATYEPIGGFSNEDESD